MRAPAVSIAHPSPKTSVTQHANSGAAYKIPRSPSWPQAGNGPGLRWWSKRLVGPYVRNAVAVGLCGSVQ
jgi:hypothetical protein